MQEEGLAVFGLTAVPDGVLFKDNIIRFWAPKGPRGLPYHALTAGDIVLISKTSPGIFCCSTCLPSHRFRHEFRPALFPVASHVLLCCDNFVLQYLCA